MGDFNAVLGAYEKRGRPPPLNIACDEFVAFTDSCDLIHIDTTGAEFMWTNGRKRRGRTDIRLDKAICSTAWYLVWSDTSCRALVREFSDYHPMLLHFDIYTRRFPKSFRFLSCWLENDSFMEVVNKS